MGENCMGSYVKLDDVLYYGLHPSIINPDIFIKYYIDLTEDLEFPDNSWKTQIMNEGSVYKHFPIKDRDIPTIQLLINIIKYCNISKNEETIYIFCRGSWSFWYNCINFIWIEI